jgi:hypothetical protein
MITIIAIVAACMLLPHIIKALGIFAYKLCLIACGIIGVMILIGLSK